MKILIELPTWLGDTIMATPAIENIVNYYNEPEITLVGSFTSIELINNHPKVVKAEVLNRKYTYLLKVARNLGKFDVFFSFRNSFRSRILKLFISSKNKYLFERNKYQNCNKVEKYIHYINDCLKTDFKAGKLNIKPSLNSSFNYSVPVVGINPGSSYGEAKRWYPEEYSEVCAKLSLQYNIVIFGGPDE